MDHNAIAMPLSGVFASHFDRRHEIVTTSNDAVLLGAGVPHHYSFPGGIGDHSLVLRWSPATLARVCPEVLDRDRFDMAQFAPQATLAPSAVVERELLWREAASGRGDTLALEERGIDLFATIMRATQLSLRRSVARRHSALARHTAQVQRVKTAIAAAPTARWTLAALADLARASPFHLARVFKSQTGVSLYEYVLRLRLARSLPWVLDTNGDLTNIALDAGFSSHSHFTEKFRARFGISPGAMRQRKHKNATAAKLMTN
jgi:AraC-like DNA-binding protein